MMLAEPSGAPPSASVDTVSTRTPRYFKLHNYFTPHSSYTRIISNANIVSWNPGFALHVGVRSFSVFSNSWTSFVTVRMCGESRRLERLTGTESKTHVVNTKVHVVSMSTV